ncbi:MAG TPA: DUF1330 domain-containing protein [Caulobacter sp.]|nr:DUF1330 domain-containing protein [Caulobacter sp.]
MSHYVVAQMTITDRDSYGRYQAAFMPVLMQYGGRLLAATEAPQVVEGDWAHQKIILLSFADEAAMRRWAESPEYQAISTDRKAGAYGVVLSVPGL